VGAEESVLGETIVTVLFTVLRLRELNIVSFSHN
jgi:hypothetical protein